MTPWSSWQFQSRDIALLGAPWILTFPPERDEALLQGDHDRHERSQGAGRREETVTFPAPTATSFHTVERSTQFDRFVYSTNKFFDCVLPAYKSSSSLLPVGPPYNTWPYGFPFLHKSLSDLAPFAQLEQSLTPLGLAEHQDQAPHRQHARHRLLQIPSQCKGPDPSIALAEFNFKANILLGHPKRASRPSACSHWTLRHAQESDGQDPLPHHQQQSQSL